MLTSTYEHTRARWCLDCGHESHARYQCLYRMTQAQIVQRMARGRPLPADLRCRCDATNLPTERGQR